MAAEPATPMMVQYRKLKNRHRDAILFFRLGDFYEMFDADAREASELLEIALTQRNGVPMCGVPHHAARSYIARLLKAGRRVAVCEQTALPAAGKGLARREVVEVVTPGTVLDEELLDGGSNNYLVAVGCAPSRDGDQRSAERRVALAALDLSTGEFRATAFRLADAAAHLGDELARLAPREMLVQESLLDDSPPVARAIHQHIPRSTVVQRYPDWQFDVAAGGETLRELFRVANLKAFGLRPDAPELAPAGLLVNFARQTARHGLAHLEGINVYGRDSFVTLDETAQRSLELVRNLEDGSRERTLLAVLDHTRTPMGARLLRRAILEPLCDRESISARLDAVEALFRRQHLLTAVRERLRRVSDLERLAGRVALSRAHPRDLRAIAASARAAEGRCRGSVRDGSRRRPGGGRGGARGAIDRRGRRRRSGGVRWLKKQSWTSRRYPLTMAASYAQAAMRSWTACERSPKTPRRCCAPISRRSARGPASPRSGCATTGFWGDTWRLPALRRRACRAISSAGSPWSAANGLPPNDWRSSTVRSARPASRSGNWNGTVFSRFGTRRPATYRRFWRSAGFWPGSTWPTALALAATTGGYTRPELAEPGSGIRIREGRHPVVEAMLPAGAFVPNDLHLDPRRYPVRAAYRTQHGRQIHLSAANRAHRSACATRLLRAGRGGVHWYGGRDFLPGGRQ